LGYLERRRAILEVEIGKREYRGICGFISTGDGLVSIWLSSRIAVNLADGMMLQETR
jgi:hypothetical protein